MNSPFLGIVLMLSVLLSFVLAVARLPAESSTWLSYARPQWILLICFLGSLIRMQRSIQIAVLEVLRVIDKLLNKFIRFLFDYVYS